MTKQTGMIVAIVVTVLTLCCSMACCASGLYTVANTGQWSDVLDTYIEWYHGAPTICLGILVWIVPLLFWLFLVRGKEDTEPPAYE